MLCVKIGVAWLAQHVSYIYLLAHYSLMPNIKSLTKM